MVHRFARAAVIAAAAVAVGACGGGRGAAPQVASASPVRPSAGTTASDAGAPASVDSLYERLGGRAGISAIVEDFMKLALEDKRLETALANTKGEQLERFKSALGEQLCELSGGPCHYAGREMKPVHRGMAITDTQFDAFVENLSGAMDMHGLCEADKSQIFAAIALYRDDIVERKKRKERP